MLEAFQTVSEEVFSETEVPLQWSSICQRAEKWCKQAGTSSAFCNNMWHASINLLYFDQRAVSGSKNDHTQGAAREVTKCL